MQWLIIAFTSHVGKRIWGATGNILGVIPIALLEENCLLRGGSSCTGQQGGRKYGRCAKGRHSETDLSSMTQ